jgi:predicted transcriptional regulator
VIKTQEDTAKNYLELASNQRLSILLSMSNNQSKPSIMSKELGVTIQEVSRNFDRLVNAGLIVKNVEGYHNLSTFGKILCMQIPSLVFLSSNRHYFEKHSLDDIPLKFKQRIGSLVQGEFIKGFVKVQERWKKIYENSNDYTYNVLSELPLKMIQLAVKNASCNIQVKNVFDEHLVIPEERKKILNTNQFRNLLQNGNIDRRMKKGININIVLNEKEAIVSFPAHDGETDLSQAFVSNNIVFHEWCLDLFRYFWYESNPFNESKLNSK